MNSSTLQRRRGKGNVCQCRALRAPSLRYTPRLFIQGRILPPVGKSCLRIRRVRGGFSSSLLVQDGTAILELHMLEQAQRVLKDIFGYDSFRGRQAAIIECVANGGDAWC